MNYLAHIFLSGENRRIQIGNFIGDAVKGSSYKNYPKDIETGILLHRAIDDFTDRHPAVKNLVQSLRPSFGRYSGIIADIYFDYLLASRFREFSDISLNRFTRGFYLNMIRNRRFMPQRIKRFMWHFIGTGRLYKYASLAGIRQSLDIMVAVHGLDISVDEAVNYLSGNEDKLFAVFEPFFAELQDFSREYIGDVVNKNI